MSGLIAASVTRGDALHDFQPTALCHGALPGARGVNLRHPGRVKDRRAAGRVNSRER